jgi:non-canonical poly(A) RNA polymerase PAPD5/7
LDFRITHFANRSSRLHKEICDFYDFAKPRHFEFEVRQDLIKRVGDAFRPSYPDGKVYSFGSFAAGIFLPTADMDLCFVSREYYNGGYPQFDITQRTLRNFMHMLVARGIAAREGQEVIAKAKVPIIKFVDALTGLKVDISFENTSGITAIKTFDDWKDQFPAMPIIVTLLKQFLLMRGIGEVFLGGLGGFSITCLVVSLLQHMPAIQSKNMKPEHNLGELLLEFLDYYGNRFNMSATSISMNPPGLFPKVSLSHKDVELMLAVMKSCRFVA